MAIDEYSSTSSFTITNSSLVATESMQWKFPSGLTAPPVLGYLSFGSPQNQQVFGARGETFNAELTVNNMETKKVIPSRSVGLHYGSAALRHEGSLVFGGYDKSRAVSKPIAYDLPDLPPFMNLQLGRVAFGVAKGKNPDDSFKIDEKVSNDITFRIRM